MTKPILRIDAYYDIQDIIASALRDIATQNHIYQCCLNCINFREGPDVCGLVNQRPPARIITFGCPQWVDKDGVPF